MKQFSDSESFHGMGVDMITFKGPHLRPRATRLKVGAAVAIVSTMLLGFGALGVPTATALGPPSTVPPVVPYTIECNVLGVITVPLTVSTFAQAPGSVHAGRPLNLHAVRSKVEIPASFVDLALSLGVSSLSGQFSALDFDATNATPSVVNEAATPIDFGPVALVQGQPATITVPRTPATVGPWTAANTGTISLSPGETDLTFDIVSLGLELPLACTPSSPVPTLATTVIR